MSRIGMRLIPIVAAKLHNDPLPTRYVTSRPPYNRIPSEVNAIDAIIPAMNFQVTIGKITTGICNACVMYAIWRARGRPRTSQIPAAIESAKGIAAVSSEPPGRAASCAQAQVVRTLPAAAPTM